MSIQEFEDNGDPENHFQALLSLAKEGIQKGKVSLILLLFTFKDFCMSLISRQVSFAIQYVASSSFFNDDMLFEHLSLKIFTEEILYLHVDDFMHFLARGTTSFDMDL